MRMSVAPVIDKNEIIKSSSDAKAIIDALKRDAAISNGSSNDYYLATVAGFNFVDDQCATYFDKLFHLNRQKNALKSGLNSFNRTTNAILAITNASTLSMTIVAQAFGITSELVDIVAGTYLYELPPSATLSFVKQTRIAYRRGAENIKAQINSPAVAYRQIQAYLSLCQPPTIEAMLSKHVANVAGIPQTNDGEVNVLVTSAPTADALPAVEQFLQSSFDVLNTPNQPSPGKTGGNGLQLTSFEASLTKEVVVSFQAALCVETDGVWGAATRAALVEFFNGTGSPRPDIAQTGLKGNDDLIKLREAVALHPVCNNGEHNSAFQLGQLAT